MAKPNPLPWDRNFLSRSPMFAPLYPAARKLAVPISAWPNIEDYQRLLENAAVAVRSKSGAPIRFVPQGPKPATFEESYEPRIFLKGEVQTRCENWHDFFQALVWTTFPKTKAALNTRHYFAAKERTSTTPSGHHRGALENALTLYDECGAAVVSCNPALLKMIREFDWKSLFWHNRKHVKAELMCFIFGHAMYEKALEPYTGMTANSVLLNTNSSFFAKPLADQLGQLDDQLSALFHNENAITAPQDFSPFPLLGMPGWHRENEHETYYDNTRYFRPGRSRLGVKNAD